MPKGLNIPINRAQIMYEMQKLMNDMNSLTSSSAFRNSLNLGLTDQIMQANKAALTLGTTLQKSVNPLTGNLNLTAFNNELNRSKMTLTDYSKQLSQLGSAGQESFKSLTKAIISAETPLTAGSRLAQEMSTVIGNTVRWQAASSAIHGVLGTVSSAVNYVKNLDSSLNDIRIVTGQSQEQMERFARSANTAAKELNTTTNQYAKASLIYYQQGLSDKQVQERTETTIKLANVSGQSAKKVSDQMTAIWNNFYDGGKSLEYYADVITALGATTASSSEEIAKGLSKFSSIAQTTGLSYEYATSALSTVVAATRQSADTVGTSFKTLFSRLQGLNLGQTLDDGTTLNKYSKALLTAGVNIKTTSGDLKDMDTILSELSEKWKALGDSEKVALAQTVGGARNYSTFMSLMENWDDFTNNLSTIQGAQGTLQKQADIYAESWAAASAHVRASAESIYSNLVDDKAFKGMINGFGSILDVAGKATDTMGGFGGMLTQVAAIATKAFGPQLSEGLSNLGYSAMTMLPGGRERVENLRQEALDNLLAKGNLSTLETEYATNFANRNRSYLEGVKNGTISSANQGLIQSLMGHVDTLETSTLAANEQTRLANEAMTESIRSTVQTANRSDNPLQRQITDKNNEITRLTEELDKALISNDSTSLTRAKQLETQLAQAQNSMSSLRAQQANYLNTNPYISNGRLDIGKYTQAISEFKTATFEQNQLKSLGALFNKADTGWSKGEVQQTISSLQKLITIGNGSGEALSAMKTNGIFGTGQDAIDMKNNLDAMIKEFNEKSAAGAGTTEDQWKEFFSRHNTTLGQLGAIGGTDRAGELQADLERAFKDSGLEGQVAKDMAAAIAAANAKSNEEGLKAETKQSQTGLTKIMDSLKKDNTTFTQGLVRDTSSIAGVASSIVSISNAMKVFNDEAATSMDKLGAFAGAMMTMPMGITGGANLLKDVASLIPGTAIAGASPVAGIIALGAAAVAGGAAFIHNQNEQIREAQYGTQLQGVTDSVASYGQYTSAITELSDSFAAQDNNYLSNLNQLSQYAEGTREYQQALTATNQSALDLINNYGLGIDSYSVSNGVVQLDNTAVEARKQQLEDLAQRATENGLIASAFTSALNLSDEAYKTTQQEVLSRTQYTSAAEEEKLRRQAEQMAWEQEEVYSDAAVQKYVELLTQQRGDQLAPGSGTYTFADLAALYVQEKQDYESKHKGESFTFEDFQRALISGYDSENKVQNVTEAGEAYRLSWLPDSRSDEIAQKINNSNFEDGLFAAMQQYFGSDNIQSYEQAGEKLSQIAQYTEDINLLKDRANAEVANLFGLAAGFEETDNAYSKLSAQILAKQTSFEDVNNLAGGTLPDTLKEISELTGNSLYDRYINDIDKNATRAMLSQYSDEVLQSALSGEVMRDLADQILQKQNEQLANIPGLTEELLKSYNSLDSLNGDAISKLLSDISQLGDSGWSHQARYDSLKNAVTRAEEKYGEDYTGRISTIGFKGSMEAAREELDKLEQDYQKFLEPIKQVQEILTTSALQDLAKTDNQLLTSLYGSINNEDLRSLLGGQDVTDSALLETLARGMSSNDKQTLANYVTAFGSQFGSDMAAEVLKGLVQEGTTVLDLGTGETYSNKYIDQNYKNILNKLDTTTAISTIYSAEQQSKLLGQNNEYGKRLNDLVEKGFESIGGEVGFFRTLWNNGEFSNLFNKLTSDASMVSMINAEVIDKAANKMDLLNQAINTDISTLNSAGIASIIQEVAKGTISEGNITESVIDAMSIAGYGDSSRVEALENIAELSDYSASSISVIEKALANQGKTFTSSFYQNQFWDQPLVEVLEQLPTGIESKYRELLINAQQTGQSSKDFQRTVKKEMPEFYKYITTVGTKKGDVSNVLQFWKDIGMFNPTTQAEGYKGIILNNLMTYNPSTGFFGFNPDAIGTTINSELNTFSQNIEQYRLEEALKAKLDEMGVLDEMLERDENGNLINYGASGEAPEYHLNTNIDTEKQARNLLMAEALLRPEWAGKSKEEIIQQYVDPAIAYMREQGGMGPIWDSGEAIEGAKELAAGGKMTSAEAARAFFNQYGDKILNKDGTQRFASGDAGYNDFLREYFGSENPNFNQLKRGIFNQNTYGNTVTQEQFKNATGNDLTFDEWLKNQSDIYNEQKGTINYDAAMEAMRQSGWFTNDAQIQSLLKDYSNTQLQMGETGQKITATIRDMYGRQQQITLGEGKYKTVDDFQKAIEDSANITDADIQANNAQRSQLDSVLINQAMQAGDQGKAASILMGLSDQGRAVFGQYASYLGLGEAWKTVETRSSAQYQQSSLDKGITNAIKQDYNAGKGQDKLVEYNGVNVSSEQLTKVQQALKAIEENTGTSAALQEALNDLVDEEGNNALTGKKEELTVDEEGNIYDEEGNLIEFDENGNPVTKDNGSKGSSDGGSSGGSSDGGSSGDGGNSNDDSKGKSASEKFSDYLSGGGEAKVGQQVYDSDTGRSYTVGQNDNGDYILEDENHHDVSDEITLASGQNNNLLPYFAAGTGTIAVTGELGPELHVKPNGDMDLLGEHGREYAWVEPSDKIYTAAQTASILGSKKIREMIDAHASGINNFIPGYFGSIGNSYGTSTGTLGSPSGGGDSGGGRGYSGGGGEPVQVITEDQNHRYDSQWLKYRDILTRYYTILEQLQDIVQELSRFAELADRAWGKERQKDIEEVIKLQEEQILAQKKYLSEINSYLKEDAQAMTSSIKEFVKEWNAAYPNQPIDFSDAEFDKNGVLTNYQSIVSRMIDAYNMSASGSYWARGNIGQGATTIMDQATGGGTGSQYTAFSGGVYTSDQAVAQTAQQNGMMNSGVFATENTTGAMTSNGIVMNNNNSVMASGALGAASGENYVNVEAQTKFEEQLKDIQKYTETLNLYQEQKIVLDQMQEQLFDTKMKLITVEFEFKATIRNNAINLIDYSLSKVRNDAYHAAEAIALIGEKQTKLIESLKDYKDEIRAIFNLNLNGDNYMGDEDYVLTTEGKASQLEKDLDKLKNYKEDEQKKIDEMEKARGELLTSKYKETYGDLFSSEEDLEKFLEENPIIAQVDLRMSGVNMDELDQTTTAIRDLDAEYSALVAETYQKYHTMYSDLLPNPDKTLKYDNRLKDVISQTAQATANATGLTTASMFDESFNIMSADGTTIQQQQLNNKLKNNILMNLTDIDKQSLVDKLHVGEDRINEIINNLLMEDSTDNTDLTKVTKTTNYGSISNADSVIGKLEGLASQLSKNEIHMDVDFDTTEFKNLGEVTDQLQTIFNSLITSHKDLGDKIKALDNDLITLNQSTGEWTLNIKNQYEAQQVLKEVNKAKNEKLTEDMFDSLMENPEQLWAWMIDRNQNFDFTNFTAAQISELSSIATRSMQTLLELQENYYKQIDLIGSSVKQYFKDIDSQIGHLTHFKTIGRDLQNILDLLGHTTTKLTQESVLALNAGVTKLSFEQVKAAKKEWETAVKMVEDERLPNRIKETYERLSKYQNELSTAVGEEAQERAKSAVISIEQEIDELEKQQEQMLKISEEKREEYMKSWEDSIQALFENFNYLLKNAITLFEEGFNPVYTTFEEITSTMSRRQSLKDLYTREYESAYELSRLNRAIQLSIIDTDNLKGKRELKKLQEEINKLKEKEVKLSSYDLDVLQKKYELELARQALEDAKNAKSVVRLSRDNSGNWGYVYSSDEEDIEEAEQNYENAAKNFAEANEIEIQGLQEQYFQILSEAEQEIANLNPAVAGYEQKVAEIVSTASEKIAFLESQFSNAFKNNNYLTTSVFDAINKTIPGLTSTFNELILAEVTGTKEFNELVDLANNKLNSLTMQTTEAYALYLSGIKELNEITDLDLINNANEIAKIFSDEMLENAETVAVKINEKMQKATDAFNKMIDSFIENTQDLTEIITHAETIIRGLYKLIEASGNYISENTIKFSTGIFEEEQLDEIKQALAREGKTWVQYVNENGEKVTVALTAGDPETERWLRQMNTKVGASSTTTTTASSKASTDSLITINRDNAAEWEDYFKNLETQSRRILYDDTTQIQRISNEILTDLKSSGKKLSMDAVKEAVKKKIASGDTGLYTGEWAGGSSLENGKLAFLHQKELVLNETDTSNILNAVEIIRQLDDFTKYMANGLGSLVIPKDIITNQETLSQEVTIHADFPNVINHSEIEEAMTNLVNMASQYVNRV